MSSNKRNANPDQNSNSASGQDLAVIRAFAERQQTPAVADLRGVVAKVAELDAEIARVRRTHGATLTAEQDHDLRKLRKALRRHGRLLNGSLPPTVEATLALFRRAG